MTPSGSIDTSLLTPTSVYRFFEAGTFTPHDGVDILGDTITNQVTATFEFSPGTDDSVITNPGAPFLSDQSPATSTVTKSFATFALIDNQFRAGFSVVTADLVDDIWTPDGQWTFPAGSTISSLGLVPGEYKIEDAVNGEGFTILIERMCVCVFLFFN